MKNIKVPLGIFPNKIEIGIVIPVQDKITGITSKFKTTEIKDGLVTLELIDIDESKTNVLDELSKKLYRGPIKSMSIESVVKK